MQKKINCLFYSFVIFVSTQYNAGKSLSPTNTAISSTSPITATPSNHGTAKMQEMPAMPLPVHPTIPSLTSYHDMAQPLSSSLQLWRWHTSSSSPLIFNQQRESLLYLLVQWSVNNETTQNLTDHLRSPLPTMRALMEPCPLGSVDAFLSPLKTTRQLQPPLHCSCWATVRFPLVVIVMEQPLVLSHLILSTMPLPSYQMNYPTL